MAKITLQLIGDINKFLRNEPNNPLQPKYMAVVTAEDLALYFRYTKGRRRGKHTFKPEVSSLIKIDPEIQRGLTTTGELRQEDSKIEEISKALMGKSQKRKPKSTNEIAASIYTKTTDPKEDLLYFKQSLQKPKVRQTKILDE